MEEWRPELTSNWENHTKLYSHQVYINHRPQEVEAVEGDADGDGEQDGEGVGAAFVWRVGKEAQTRNNRRKSVKNCRP